MAPSGVRIHTAPHEGSAAGFRGSASDSELGVLGNGPGVTLAPSGSGGVAHQGTLD